MSDIFREVDEEFKRDQFAQFLKKHGNLIIAAMLLLVLGVGGWRGYTFYEQKKAAEAGARFEEAMRLSGEGKAAEARTMLEALAKDGPTGYQQLSRFRLASDVSRTDPVAAAKAFEALAADTGLEQNFRDLAKVRAAALLVDTAPLSEIVSRLEPFTAPGQAWRLTAREAIGLAAFKAGDTATADKYLQMIMIDPEATPGGRQRAELLLSLTRSGSAPAK